MLTQSNEASSPLALNNSISIDFDEDKPSRPRSYSKSKTMNNLSKKKTLKMIDEELV